MSSKDVKNAASRDGDGLDSSGAGGAIEPPGKATARASARAGDAQSGPPGDLSGSGDVRLSYKFQRLREKLRAAITSGELSGKLPGERQLAKRFRVNAKTLSKALTDLAAEGMLERSIGRGTFVRGPAPSAESGADAGASAEAAPSRALSSGGPERRLILCDEADADSPLVRQLSVQRGAAATVVHDTANLRPSFLSGFRTVISLDPTTEIAFLRDMVVRGATVVLGGYQTTTYSMNAVLIDVDPAVNSLARELMLGGHRKFVAVEAKGKTDVSGALRRAAARYAPNSVVAAADPAEVLRCIDEGATAIVCDGVRAATQVRRNLQAKGVDVPRRVSIVAVGACNREEEDPSCTGCFVSVQQQVEAIVQLVREGHLHRPVTLWLLGKPTDVGTTAPRDLVGKAPEVAGTDNFDAARL